MRRIYYTRNITLGLIISFVVITFFGWLGLVNLKMAKKETAIVDESLQSLRILEVILDDMQDIETATRGFVISGKEEFLAPYFVAIKRIANDTLDIKSLSALYPERQSMYDTLQRLISQKLNLAELSIYHMKNQNKEAANRHVQDGEGRIVMDKIRQIIYSFEDKDIKKLHESNDSRQKAANNLVLTILVIGLVFILMFVMLYRRVRIEMKKREEDEREILYLANLVQRTGDAIISLDMEGVILTWNPAAEELFGYQAKEAVGANFREFTSTDFLQSIAEEVKSELRLKGTSEAEISFSAKDGKEIKTLISVKHLYDKEEKPAGYVCVIRDVTQRKLASDLLLKFNKELADKIKEKTEEIKKEEEKLKQVLDSAAGEFYVINKDYEIILISKPSEFNLARAWGKPVKAGNKILDCIPPEKLDYIKSNFDKVFQGNEVEYESQIIVGGEPKWIQVNYLPVKGSKNEITGSCVITRDITERKLADNQQRESLERFSLIGKATSDSVWEWNFQTGKMWANENHQLMYGLTLNDPVPSTDEWLARIHPDERERVKLSQAEALESDSNVFITEYRFRFADNKYRYIYDRCYIVRNEQGKPVKMMGSMMDITDRIRAEEAIRVNEETQRLIMNSALDAIVCIDTKSVITIWTPQAEKIFGWKAEEVIGLSLTDTIIPLRHRSSHKNAVNNYLKTGQQKVLGRLIEISATNKSGNEFPVELSIVHIKQGSNEFFCAFIRDISQRKQAELEIRSSNERFELIAKTTNDAIWEWNLETGHLWGSDAHQKLYGLTTKDPVPDQSEWVKRIHPEERETVLNDLRKAIADPGTNAWITEYRFLSGDQYLAIYDRSYIVRDGSGKAIRIMGAMMDITERKQAEEELIKSRTRFRNLVENISGVYWVNDITRRQTLYISPSYELIWGRSCEDLYKNPADFINSVHPDDKQYLFEEYEAIAQKRKLSIVYRIIRPDKTIRWIAAKVNVVTDENGNDIEYGYGDDITEQKRAEEEMLKSTERFNIVSKATSDIVWDWFMAENTFWWNDNYYSTIGVPRSPGIATIDEWFQRLHPEDYERVRKKFLGAIGGDQHFWSDEYRYRKNDGSYLNMYDRGYIIRNSSGIAIRMIGSMIDMTQMLKVQKEVEESENRLRTIFNSEPECIKLLDINGQLLDMNPAGLSMIEADSLEQVKNKSVLGIINEDYRIPFASLCQDVFKGNPGKLLFSITGLKGTRRWMETHAVPLRDGAGKITALLAVTRDITDKKQTEEELIRNERKYRTVVEQAIDAIALYDANGKLLDVNTGAINLLGYTREELQHMSLKDVLTDDEIKVRPVQYDVLKTGKSTVKQRSMRKKDGTIVQTEVRSQQLPDGRFLSVIRDLTDRIKAEEELKESYKAIRTLTDHLQKVREEERAHIAREIHDELGQQLTVLKMDIAWLNKKIDASDESPLKIKMKELLTMLDGTVRTVRRISSELRPSLLDDMGLFAAMEWHLEDFSKRTGLETSLVAGKEPEKLPDNIKTGLYRIFQESLTNVARHANATKVIVKAEVKDKVLRLSIADNGTGFDTSKVKSKKTLGILGMQERSSMMGGDYSITTTPGKGTTIVVSVPINL
ncbi:MAG TPA: PAS domain S-box protein [Chitinophagaceae bacterium]|nr:PAS domain S-box protein [Chitinophagaceae bacterium]